jgi:hypothetical protein
MAIRLELRARDVSQLPELRPAPDPKASPERVFTIAHVVGSYKLEYDGRHANVPDPEIKNLLMRLNEGTSVEWRQSSDSEIQATFRPLNRVLQCLNSTPAYQLFLAGFHIADTIGMFEIEQIQESAIVDRFKKLSGNLPWLSGKRGRLFFIPDEYNAAIELELLANNKIIVSELYVATEERIIPEGRKLVVPYATPIGFNTQVSPETKVAWRGITSLVTQDGGGPIQ